MRPMKARDSTLKSPSAVLSIQPKADWRTFVVVIKWRRLWECYDALYSALCYALESNATLIDDVWSMGEGWCGCKMAPSKQRMKITVSVNGRKTTMMSCKEFCVDDIRAKSILCLFDNN